MLNRHNGRAPRRAFCSLAVALGLGLGTGCTGEAGVPPEWDQGAAKALLHQLFDAEALPEYAWDAIPWHTEPEDAIRAAKVANKPILVFFYVNRGGPPDAPC